MLKLPRISKGSPAISEEEAAQSTVEWRDFTDGRLRRLKRGVDYESNVPSLLQEAQDAAAALGKKAFTYHDQLGKFDYVWVQFLDGRLGPDGVCGECESTSLERTQEYFLRCRSCGALFKMVDNRPTTGAAEFLGVRLLSLDGEETEEISVLDEAVIEAICHFSRPVAAAQLKIVFVSGKGKRKALSTSSPYRIVVPRPDTVTLSLHLDARVLSPGDYSAKPSIELVLDDQDRRLHKISAKSFGFRVVDPAPEDHGGTPRKRSRLHWEVIGSNDQPMPIFTADAPGALDDDEDDDL